MKFTNRKLGWIAAIIVLLCILLSAARCQSQVLTVTNGDSVLTISNNVVISTVPLPVPGPILVTTNGQVIPAALTAEIAQSLGIPSFIVQMIPLKLLLWLGALVWFLPYAGRAWHAFKADGGFKGITNAVVFGTNVPVAMKGQATGKPVVPPVPEQPQAAAPKAG